MPPWYDRSMKKVMSGIEAFLFDMDGTLVDSTGAVEICWSEWARRHGLSAPQVLHFIHGRPARDSIRALAPHADVEFEVNWMLERELNERSGVKEIPGARAFLLALSAQQVPWAIVTSADRRLAQLRLTLAGIPQPAVMITVNDVQKGKPDPEGYLKAAGLLGVLPRACVVVEDAPAGLEAGRRAGAQTLTVDAHTDYARWSYERAEKNVRWN